MIYLVMYLIALVAFLAGYFLRHAFEINRRFEEDEHERHHP